MKTEQLKLFDLDEMDKEEYIKIIFRIQDYINLGLCYVKMMRNHLEENHIDGIDDESYYTENKYLDGQENAYNEILGYIEEEGFCKMPLFIEEDYG